MSAGAVFKLIANDGKADRMIMATKLLNQRIKDVMCARKRAGKADITPTLVDLERTHILYVNAHFKPFAAIGYEYNKVRPQSGTATLGGGVTFSIPQFGDFFHDMVCRTRLGKFTGRDLIAPSKGVTNTALYPADPLVAGGVSVTRRLVDAAGNAVIDGSTYRNYVRYCEYPGNRLFSLVKFDVNGNPLDQYDSMVPTMLEKFCTAPNKRAGHDRLVGQEVPLQGYSGLKFATVTDADVASATTWNTPSGIGKHVANQSNQTVGLFKASAAAKVGAPIAANDFITMNNYNTATESQYDISRQLQQVVNGPQTPKPSQAPLEIWNKLRFWFNDDVRLSIASVSIPFGQRFITIDLATQNLLAFEFPSIYVETVTSDIDFAAGGVANQVSRTVTYAPYMQFGGTTDIAIEKMELYINNIFVNPEVHDIYIKRIGFSLIRVYRQHTQRCNQESSDDKLLAQLKWPIEYMFMGLRPVWNIKAASGTNGNVTGNQNQWRDWHRLTRLVDATTASADYTQLDTITAVGAMTTTSATLPGIAGTVNKIMADSYYLPVPTVDSLTLTSHGITIFDGFNDTFFNQYMPFHYGGAALCTPDDPGALFVNMSLFPRSYGPSGHLNVSRARETYIKWTTSYVSAATPADLIAVGVALNFLLITDGSAVLRYST